MRFIPPIMTFLSAASCLVSLVLTITESVAYFPPTLISAIATGIWIYNWKRT